VTELGHALAVPGFVVVPGVDFYHGTVNNLGAERIDDAAARVVGVIRRHEGHDLVSENALERSALARLFQGGIDFFHRDGAIHFKDAVCQTAISEWDTDRQTIQLAL
jgi:hypothetical protein